MDTMGQLRIYCSCHKRILWSSNVSSLVLQVASCLVHVKRFSQERVSTSLAAPCRGTFWAGPDSGLAWCLATHLKQPGTHPHHFSCLLPLLGCSSGAEPNRFRQNCNTTAGALRLLRDSPATGRKDGAALARNGVAQAATCFLGV